MIQRNNNLSVLPFYSSIEEQNHRKTYSFGDVYPLYAPIDSIPAFQVVIAHTTATISSVKLYDSDGTYRSTITTYLTSGGLTKKDFAADEYDVLVYPATASEAVVSVAEGQHYLVIEMSDTTKYYSDIFTAVGMIGAFLKVQWWDATDFVMDGCRIVYPLGENSVFQNTLYLNTELGKPEYEFNEEGEQRDGYFFPEQQISEKKYKATFLASEYLCDVMRFIRMADYVKITDKYGNIYRADTFLITPKWEAQGNLASVDMEFTCDTVAKKIARPVSSVGDFNEDYNESFFN